MRLRQAILILFIALAAAIFVYARVSSTSIAPEGGSSSSGDPQQRRRPSRRAAPAQRSRRPAARDYSKFSHRTPRHRSACSSCHEIPTPGSARLRGHPDITDYPDHDSCVSCHRQQFFSGARPVICSICHTKVSPRDEARFAFRNPAGARQFTIEFPHDKHQDVIALDGRERETHPQPMLRVMHASFSSAPDSRAIAVDDKEQQFNNCSICHETNERETRLRRGGWPDAFVPTARTFKTVPRSHASCFDCHWKNQEPTSRDCAGCHKVTGPYAARDWPARISLKFTHEREQHVAECTVCHINITRASTLRGLKADVPITSCKECHLRSTDADIVTIRKEMEQRAANSGFVCSKCHTSDVGRRAAPPSHYALIKD
jgi:Class III cytochrome C family